MKAGAKGGIMGMSVPSAFHDPSEDSGLSEDHENLRDAIVFSMRGLIKDTLRSELKKAGIIEPSLN
jgi:hypothetical protein